MGQTVSLGIGRLFGMHGARRSSAAARPLFVAFLLVALLAPAMVTDVAAATFSARAFVQPSEHYLGEFTRPLTITVRNTGGTKLGAVDIARPNSTWTVNTCTGAPAGWSTVTMSDRCRFTSAASAGDDIAPGDGVNFKLTVSTSPGTQDRSGLWVVRVSRTNSFAVAADVRQSSDPQEQLQTIAYSLQITNAVFTSGAAAPGSVCPANQRPLRGSSGNTVVICGRNRTTISLTPTLQFAALEGNFIAAVGGFTSGPTAPTNDSRVLGSFTNVTVTSTPYANNLVVPRIAASSTQMSPYTPLDGYTTLSDPPHVTTSGGSTAYTENAASVAIDSALTVSDPDDTNLESAVVTISSGRVTGDTLSFTNTASITGSYNSGTGVLSLTGHATITAYRDALRSVRFSSTSNNPGTSRQVSFSVNDGDSSSANATKSISVTPLNDAPTVTTTGTALSYGEGSGAVAIDPGLLVSDPDSANLSGATVQITSNFVSADDDLSFANQAGISGSYSDVLGKLTLTGSASVAAYQAALRTVKYTNSSDNPTGSKTVSFQATDASAAPSNIATRTINLGAANDAPSITVPATAVTYPENGSPVVVSNDLTVSDPDDANLESAVVSISSGLHAGDTLNFTNQSGISMLSFTGGVLTLTGTSSKANYQAALRSITFSSTSDNPGSSRQISFKVNDGDADSNTAAKTLAVTPSNDAPVLDTTDAPLAYTDGAGAIAIDPLITADDPDSANLTGATVAITGGYNAGEDTLAFSNTATITVLSNTGGVLTLTGTDTVANYQAALRSVTYSNSASHPVDEQRVVTYQATDSSAAASNLATRTINISEPNATPVADSQGPLGFVEDSVANSITLTASDADDDGLTFTAVDPANGTLSTLTPAANCAAVNTCSATLTYTPDANYAGADSFTFKVNDGTIDSADATVSITVSAVNDAPVLSDTLVTMSAENEDAPAPVGSVGTPVSSLADLTPPAGGQDNVTDPDSGAVTGIAITATTGGGTWWYSINNGTNWTSFSPPTGSTARLVAAANGRIFYQPAANENGTLSPAITFRAWDGTSGSNGSTADTTTNGGTTAFSTATDTADLTINSANDAPVLADTSLTLTAENEDSPAPVGGVGTPVTALASATNVTDADAGPSYGIAITATTGAGTWWYSTDNGTNWTSFVAPTGAAARLIASANGRLYYQPPANFNGLLSPAITIRAWDTTSGTNGGTADTTTNGGSTAFSSATDTATLTITAVNDAPSLDASKTPVLTTQNEDDPAPVGAVGTAVSSLVDFAAPSGQVDNVTDPDTAAVLGIAITATTGGGTWWYSTNNGTNWTSFAAPTGSAARLVAASSGRIYYQPAANVNGTLSPAITFRAWDVTSGSDGGTADTTTNGGTTAFSTATDTANLTVNPVNDPPVATNDSFDTIGNTELRVDMTAGTTPNASETTSGASSYEGALDNDSDPVEGDPISITAVGSGCGDATAPFDCTLSSGAVVHVDANGEFSFTPGPGDTSDSFQYTVTDQPSVGSPASAIGTVTMSIFEMVWYVKQGASGNGTSISPLGNFDNLDGAGGVGDSDDASDYLFVHNSGSLALSASVPLETSEHVLGEGVGLSIPVNLNGNGSPTNLVAAGTKPALTLAAGDMFSVASAMPVEIRGLAMSAAGGNVLDVTSAAALSGSSTLTFADNTINGAGAEGIDVNLNSGTTGTLALAITNNSWNTAGTHTGNAIDINRAAGTLNVNVSSNTNVVSNGTAISIAGGAVANTTVVGFADNTVHGNTGSTGVAISNVTFDAAAGGAIQLVDGNNLGIGASGNAVGGGGLSITTSQGNLFFDDLDIFSATSTALAVTGTGSGLTFAVQPSPGGGSSTIDEDSGRAIDISTATIDLRLLDLDSDGATSGVGFASVGGTFSAPSGSTINKATGGGTAFIVSNSVSGASFSYGGTMNVTSGAGVSLTSNTGSTIAFTGDIDLSTGTNTAFNATGGGTVTATGSGSTLTTGTGTALDVENTTIGLGGLAFQSISANGGSHGIVLDTTGASGGLAVTGTGSAGSGGTIQAIGGADLGSSGCAAVATAGGPVGVGIFLNSTKNASFAYMNFPGTFGNFGILGYSVNGFTLDNTTMTGTYGDNVNSDDDTVHFCTLTGSATISNSTISNGAETNLRVVNASGTLNRLTLSNDTIGLNQSGGGDGTLFEADNSGTVFNATVLDTTFQGSRASPFQAVPQVGTTMDLVFGSPGHGNTVHNTHGNIVSFAQDFNLAAGGTLTFDVNSNHFDSAAAVQAQGGVFINAANSTAVASGYFRNNTIGISGVTDSGSSGSDPALDIESNGGGDLTIVVTNNQIYQYGALGAGFLLQAGANAGSPVTFNATITNNTIAEPGSWAVSDMDQGFQLNNGTNSPENFTSCVSFTGNSFATSGTGAGGDGRFRQRFDTKVNIPGYTGASSGATLDAYIAGLNSTGGPTITHVASTAGGGGFFNTPGGAPCATPGF